MMVWFWAKHHIFFGTKAAKASPMIRYHDTSHPDTCIMAITFGCHVMLHMRDISVRYLRGAIATPVTRLAIQLSAVQRYLIEPPLLSAQGSFADRRVG